MKRTMWRRWVGLVLGALLGYAAGAGAGVRLLAWLSAVGVGDAIASGSTAAFVLGPLAALVGAMVGYRRGQVADFNRR